MPVVISIIHGALLINSCHGAFVCPSHWSPRCGFFSPTLPLRAHNAIVNDSNLACGQDVADACMFLSPSVACRSHCPVRSALSQSACVLGSRFALSQSACSISTFQVVFSVPTLRLHLCQVMSSLSVKSTKVRTLPKCMCRISMAVVRSATNSGFPAVYTYVHALCSIFSPYSTLGSMSHVLLTGDIAHCNGALYTFWGMGFLILGKKDPFFFLG